MDIPKAIQALEFVIKHDPKYEKPFTVELPIAVENLKKRSIVCYRFTGQAKTLEKASAIAIRKFKNHPKKNHKKMDKDQVLMCIDNVTECIPENRSAQCAGCGG